MAAPLVPSTTSAQAAHQVFGPAHFDLAGKQVTFTRRGSGGSYLLTTDSPAGIVELDQTWEVAEEVQSISLGIEPLSELARSRQRPLLHMVQVRHR